MALTPVRDMVMLDPFNTWSLAFQVFALKEHLANLPSLLDDGMLEEPNRILLPLMAEVQTADADDLDVDKMLAFEQALMRLSNAIAGRYFCGAPTPCPPSNSQPSRDL